MDLQAIREMVGRTTRDVFGVPAQLVPMIASGMKNRPDPEREIIEGIKGRFEESSGELKQFGEMKLIPSSISISFMTSDLPWTPRSPDKLVILEPRIQQFEVQFSAEDHTGRTHVTLLRI